MSDAAHPPSDEPPIDLAGRRLLVVEDEYLLARQLARELRALGAEVVGPAASVAQALALIAAQAPLDGAVLDMNLRGELAHAVADALVAREVPFVIASGFDSGVVAERHAGAPRREKPVEVAEVARLLRAAQRR